MTASWKSRVARLVRAVAVARAWHDLMADTHPDMTRARLAALRERELGCAVVHVRRLHGAIRVGTPVQLALLIPRMVGYRLGSWLVDRELHDALRRAHRRVTDEDRAELEVATRFIGLFRNSPGPACASLARMERSERLR